MLNASLPAPATVEIRSVDSINHVVAEDRDRVIVASSHGGLYCAYKAQLIGARGLILNDAGVGRNRAGIAALAYCDVARMPAATVSHLSARIGDVVDMRRRGVVSHANEAARALGVVPGMACEAAATAMRVAAPSAGRLSETIEDRHEILVNGTAIICIDSASLLRPEDRGRVVVTGSHGGLIGGDPAKALNVDVRFAAFNDAGVGVDDAGIGRLEPLDRRGIPAVTVAHDSAEIGNALSTYEEGVISHANSHAQRIGARPGRLLKDALSAWIAHGEATSTT